MVSLRKTFFLTFSLACLLQFGDSYTLVPGIAVPKNSPIPQRRELRTFTKDAISLNIYLIALERMQQTGTDQLLSYYLISAIHATNLVWDGDTGGNFGEGLGYCYHAHRLFPTWHRPYMSLYEKTLLDVATEIVQGFPAGNQKTKHLNALATWRMPYWDWAMDSSMPSVLRKKKIAVTKMQKGKLKRVSIPNPLYSYRLQIPNDPNVSIFDPTPYTVETVRNPTVKDDTYVSRPGFTNKQMMAIEDELKSGVYTALTGVTDYNAFSNSADSPDSIESVHNTVHFVVGGFDDTKNLFGQMIFSTYAAFDPIFYLHHTNVDRLFAIWQALNPNSYLTNDASEFPNEDTELHPFRKTNDQYWTSKLARDIKAFGYTYPELSDSKQQTVTEAVNDLYGSSTSNGKRKKRAFASTKVSKRSVSTKYNEYKAEIQILNVAAKGSFGIGVFFGEPSSDLSNYTADPNFVGLLGVFGPKDAPPSHKKLIQGSIPLTKALDKLISKKQLRGMTSEDIKTYLNGNLQVRVLGDQSHGFDSTNFQINVVSSELNLPSKKNVKPVWGKVSGVFKAKQTDLSRRTKFLPASKVFPEVEIEEEVDSEITTDDSLI